jgi:hypothetical protein
VDAIVHAATHSPASNPVSKMPRTSVGREGADSAPSAPPTRILGYRAPSITRYNPTARVGLHVA